MKTIKLEPGVNDKRMCWVVAIDTDSFNYTVNEVYLADVEKHNREVEKWTDRLKPYFTQKEAQQECDTLNSM